MKKFILSVILILGFFFAQSQYLYTPDESTPLPYDVPANVYVFNYGLEKWCLTSTAITSGTNLTTAITLGYAHYVDTGGGTPAPSASGGNYINFTGVEWATAQQNADSLALAFTRGNEIFIQKGVYNMAAIVIPEGKTLRFEQGAEFNVVGTLTGNYTGVNAGMYQVFNLDADIQGTWTANNGMAYPEWFGAKGDGTGTNDAAAIQKTLEVFCKATYYGDASISNGRILTSGMGSTVMLKGNLYILEKTIDFPQHGILKGNGRTVIQNSTANMYETFIYITDIPYNIDGIQFVVRRWDEMDGWATSAQDYAAQVEWAYNENFVIDFYIRHTQRAYQESLSRRQSGLKNLTFSISGGALWTQSYANRGLLCFDAIRVMTVDTLQTSGLIRSNAKYRTTNYISGDDFSNVASIGANANVNGAEWWGFGMPYNEYAAPNNWSGGSSLTLLDNEVYFLMWNNLTFNFADSALYMNGVATSHNNSYMFDNLMFDMCNSCIILGEDANSHSFTNVYIQPSPNEQSRLPVISIDNSGFNRITGVFMDATESFCNDSTILIMGSPSGNEIDLASSNDIIPTLYATDFVGRATPNLIGASPLFQRQKSTSPNLQESYYFKPGMLAFTAINNLSRNWSGNPRAMLDITARQGYSGSSSIYLPQLLPLYLQLEREDPSAGWSDGIATQLGMADAIKINQYSTNARGEWGRAKGGTGMGIRFVLSDSLNGNTPTDYYEWDLGIIGFRQAANTETATNTTLTNGGRGVFQVWQANYNSISTESVYSNIMTIDTTGKMGLNGVVAPQAAIDLVGTTGNTSGALNTGQRIITNIGNFHPYGTLPTTGMKQGDMVFVATSATDGDMYVYTGSAWKAITRDP